MKNLSKFINYITEELTDIPAEGKNLHFTNIEALLQILKSKKLKGSNYFIKSDKYNKKSGNLEIATLRNNYMSPEHNYDPELSENVDNVKITLYTDRIRASVRGIKKNQIAEFPLEYKAMTRIEADTFERKFKKPMPKLSIDASKFLHYSSIKTPKLSEYLEKWCREHGYPIDAVDHIGYYYKHLAEYKNSLIHREKEERFEVDEKGIPADPKYMKIEIFKKPSDFFADAFAKIPDDPKEKEEQANYIKDAILTLTKSDPNLLIRNSYFDDLINMLKKCYKKIQSK